MILRLGIFPIFFSGWSSFNSYATLGSVRAIAQTISYEIILGFILFFYLFFFKSRSLNLIRISSLFLFKLIIFFPLFGLWIISLLIETNVTPFDFVEGESELVSGFNVEYRGVLFSLIFIAEYNRILFLSNFSTIFFFKERISFSRVFLISTFLVFF